MPRDLGLQTALAAFIVVAYFTLSVQVHENHFFLALPLLAMAAALRPAFVPVFAALSAAFALNLYLTFGVRGDGPPPLIASMAVVDPGVVVAVIVCALFGWFAVVLRPRMRRSRERRAMIDRPGRVRLGCALLAVAAARQHRRRRDARRARSAPCVRSVDDGRLGPRVAGRRRVAVRRQRVDRLPSQRDRHAVAARDGAAPVVVPLWILVALTLTPVLPWVVVRSASSWRGAFARTHVPILLYLCWAAPRTLLQFSLLSMTLAWTAVLIVNARPSMGGVALGVALFKPHLAGPVALWMLVAGRIRPLIVAAGSRVPWRRGLRPAHRRESGGDRGRMVAGARIPVCRT